VFPVSSVVEKLVTTRTKGSTGEITRGRFAHWNCISRENFRPLQQSELPRVSGYYTVSVYEVHHEHEYNAIRNACALIDIFAALQVSVTGKDATKLVNRVITRDVNKVAVGQVIYACWCDETRQGHRRWPRSRASKKTNIAGPQPIPSLRWFRQNGLNMDVSGRRHLRADRRFGAARPGFGKALETVAEADIANLKYFRKTSGKIAGVPWISRAPDTPAT